jgi:hypothetical protein
MGKSNDEALARIEHKVDVTLDLLMEMIGRMGIIRMIIPKMGDHSHQCPICKKDVKYVVDLQDKSVTAQCSCKTGKFAPIDLEQFAPPMVAGGRDVESEGVGNSADDGDSGPRARQPHGRSR